MLLAHLTLTETGDHDDFDAVMRSDRSSMVTVIEATVQTALANTRRALATIADYAEDGAQPYIDVLVTSIASHGELDSAEAWGERFTTYGGGVHVGLVLEGHASGPRYVDPRDPDIVPGVADADWDHRVVDVFCTHLAAALTVALRHRLALAPTYHVTNLMLFEQVSTAHRWTPVRTLAVPTAPTYNDVPVRPARVTLTATFEAWVAADLHGTELTSRIASEVADALENHAPHLEDFEQDDALAAMIAGGTGTSVYVSSCKVTDVPAGARIVQNPDQAVRHTRAFL